MKPIAVAAALLVILSLATPAIAYERDVPEPDAGDTVGELADEARAAGQRLIEEHAPDPTADPEDHEDPDSEGDQEPGRAGVDPHHPAGGADGLGVAKSIFCGHIQFQSHDCAVATDPAEGDDESHEEAVQDLLWVPFDLLGVQEPAGPPATPDVDDTQHGLVGALGALFEPVQQAGVAAKRAMADTLQTTGLILREATAYSERQVAEMQRQIAHLGDKFFNIVTGQAPTAEPPRGSPAALEPQSVAEPVAPAKATGVAMATVGGIGLLVGAFAVLRRLVGLGSISLLSRIPSKDIMKNDTRASIFDIVQNDPGVSLNEIVGRLGISRNAVAYHLAVFESETTVVSVKDGKYRRYFVNGGKYVNGAKDVVSTIKNDVTLHVIRYILDNPGSIQKEVCQAVGTSPSATNWHITRLEKVGLVAKQKVANTVRYTPGPSFDKYDLGEFGLGAPGTPALA